jgi:catalase (peroxidase I)
VQSIITNHLVNEVMTADIFTQSNIFGIAVRLSFHDAGEVDVNSNDLLGSDGCLTNTADNAGLIEPTSLVNTVIEPLWQTVCNRITRADFWVLYASLVVQISEPTDSIDIPYYYGRKDNANCSAGAGRLPLAQPGLSEFRRVFVDQMGLTLAEGVTLLGAHTLGHVHPQVSGYGHIIEGLDYSKNYTANAFGATPHQFDNKYFQILISLPWKSHLQVNRTDITFWSVLGSKIIMLNADMNIAFPINVDTDPITGYITGKVGEICRSAAAFAVTDGEGDPPAFSVQCSNVADGSASSSTISGNNVISGYTFTPTSVANTIPPETELECEEYVTNNDSFLNAFSDAFVRMTTVGFDVSQYGLISAGGGKLGPLTFFGTTGGSGNNYYYYNSTYSYGGSYGSSGGGSSTGGGSTGGGSTTDDDA